MRVRKEFLAQAFAEDLGEEGDITSLALISKQEMGFGRILAKQDLRLCGIDIAYQVFSFLQPKIQWTQYFHDGEEVEKGNVIATVEGPLHQLLSSERIALNLLQHLSGISTLTAEYVSKTIGTKVKILDTRKTLPLYRDLEKYAVRMGGGMNHRMGLYDQMMIKDNHVHQVNMLETVQTARVQYPHTFLIVEIHRHDQIEPAIQGGADRLLLDNMDDEQLKKAIEIIQGRVPIEISGGITLEKIALLSLMNIDYISVGAITHSVKSCDISLKIERIPGHTHA
ncbi:MAG: carboxylating nicotinate-nucleotide diphosphorylase [Bdellovibrionota bacterium]